MHAAVLNKTVKDHFIFFETGKKSFTKFIFTHLNHLVTFRGNRCKNEVASAILVFE